MIERLFACTVMLLAAAPARAADLNGYTALYECRAGGPNCDVDVAALAALPCDQIITAATAPATDWSAINWLRTGAASTCTAATSTGCFLYRVTVAGTSAGSPPSYATTLGGTTTDGTMVVQAIRGPYAFKRKLRTVAGGETGVIPYAQAHSSAPENNFCPGIAGTF
ncbi:MAG: hypothetical protein AAB262_05430 [Elusimicrobiota bacterium]